MNTFSFETDEDYEKAVSRVIELQKELKKLIQMLEVKGRKPLEKLERYKEKARPIQHEILMLRAKITLHFDTRMRELGITEDMKKSSENRRRITPLEGKAK